MDEPLRQRLDTLPNAEVEELGAVDDEAWEALGFEQDNYNEEFWGPHSPESFSADCPENLANFLEE